MLVEQRQLSSDIVLFSCFFSVSRALLVDTFGIQAPYFSDKQDAVQPLVDQLLAYLADGVVVQVFRQDCKGSASYIQNLGASLHFH